jgi:hypothetical protein
MSQPTPMSRTMMQTLKADKDEEARQKQIKAIVTQIYNGAYTCAKNGQGNSYNYPIPIVNTPAHLTPNVPCLSRPGISFPAPYKKCSDPFHLENMSDILTTLQHLFPECSISHSIMARAKDGKLYDVSKLDDVVLPFVDRALDQSYIVIDWS